MNLLPRVLTAIAISGLIFSACECGDDGLVDAAAKLELDPETLDFGRVPVGGQRIVALQMTNRGQSLLAIESMVLESETNEFAFATPVPENIQPEQTLDFNVVFEPSSPGQKMGTITIKASDSADPRVVQLVGIGAEGVVEYNHNGSACADDPNSIDFGSVVPGMTQEQVITLTIGGTNPVQILSAVVEPGSTAEWTLSTPALPATLQPGDTLDMTASYAPVDGGPDVGAFVITTDAPAAPSIRIPTCGTGVAPAVCIRPVPLALPVTTVGGTTSGTMTIESCGAETVTVSAIAISADAGHESDPGFTLGTLPALPVELALGETIDVPVEFTAAALGNFEAEVKVTSTALNNTEAYSPVIVRVGQPCDLFVAPTSMNFPNVAVGATLAKNVLLANDGAAECSISRVELTAGVPEFALPGLATLPITIGPGSATTIAVEFRPTVAGPQMGTLEVEEGGVVTTVELFANPDTTNGCHLDVVPAAMNFGGVPIGDNKAAGVEMVNISDSPCVIQGVALAAGSDSDFQDTNSSFGLILPGRSKTLTALYTPSHPGSATGALEVQTTDVSIGSFSIPMFGTAADAGICVDPRNLDFGDVLGTALLDFTIYACGTQAVTINDLTFTTPDTEFRLVNPPATPFTMQQGATQTITVEYMTQDTASDTAVVTVVSTDIVEPAIDVTLTGGPEIVPPTAGRFLYYWQIPNVTGGDVMKLPLQGVTVTQPFWGPRTGKSCAGCHTLSPDGKYVAVVEGAGIKIVDTRTNLPLTLPNSLSAGYFSWRPNVNTVPPYQYAYDNGSDIQIGALFDGNLRVLQGADDPTLYELMPSWGPSGKIAFARGAMVATDTDGNGVRGFNGPSDILMVDENGGAATLLAGASNDAANYYPQISPNGDWVAYTYSAAAQSTIAAPDAILRLAPSDNSGTISGLPNLNSLPGDGASSYPTWAVDGSHLSFSSNRAGGLGDWDIYIAPLNPMTGVDGNAINVQDANTAAYEHSAWWSP